MYKRVFGTAECCQVRGDEGGGAEAGELNRWSEVRVRLFTSWTTWPVCFLAAPILNTSCPLREREREDTMRPSSALLLGDRTHKMSHMEGLACDGRFLVLGTLQVLFHQFGRHTDDMLTLPVLDHVEGLQGADDVTLSDAGHLAEEKRGGVRVITEANM